MASITLVNTVAMHSLDLSIQADIQSHIKTLVICYMSQPDQRAGQGNLFSPQIYNIITKIQMQIDGTNNTSTHYAKALFVGCDTEIPIFFIF